MKPFNLEKINFKKNRLKEKISAKEYISLSKEDSKKYTFVLPRIGSAGYGYYKLKDYLWIIILIVRYWSVIIFL